MKRLVFSLITLSAIFLNSCRDADLLDELSETASDSTDLVDYPDWSEETHGNSALPDYGIVFNQNEVLRLDITISSSDWTLMQANLSDILGTGFYPGPGGGGPGGGGIGDVDVDDPDFFPCSIHFNGIEWYHVGIRYKGNSSLRSTYQSGNKKLSFKLDFDEFEDDYPGIKNQRFFGFKQLNLNNNFDDQSLMREKVGADMFREFGLISAQTAFCVVYIDNGSGSQYYGVYALVEEVDDTVIETQLGDFSGNLYKPDGSAASFAQGTFDPDEMYLKNNGTQSNYSDVEGFYTVLNSSLRTTELENWKNNLEAVFNVDVFMKWLAANTAIQNWDTYGLMTHNYYLYNNPDEGKLNWIPWDNNEAFQVGKQGGALSLSFSEVGNYWPLIRYLVDVGEYETKYKTYLNEFIQGVFEPSRMIDTYTRYYELLKDFAYAEETGYTFIRYDSQFDTAVSALKSHVQERNNEVNTYLKQ